MTTLTIGRFSMSDGPTAIRHDGNNLDLDLQIDAATTTSVTVAKVLRQQLLGLAENEDEPVVPITFDDDTDMNGFYAVEGVSCEPFEMFLNNGTMTASVSLRRVAGGFAFPQQEMVTGAVTRTNAHGLTGEAVSAVWLGVTNAITGGTPWVANSFTRVSSDSATALQIRTATPPTALTSFSWWAPPAVHYYGAARVEFNIGGNWYPVVGRQVPLSDYWRITNGLIRLTSGDSTTPGTIETWTGSAWESRNIRHFTAAGVAGMNIGLAYDSDRSPVTLIRNSPERAIVRCATDSLVMDYSVQRGHRHVEMTPSGTGNQRGIGLDSSHAAACTAITGGIRATANDANGNQIVFGMAGGTLVTNLVSGFIYSSGGGTATLMAGLALDGSGATTFETPAELMKQFIGIAPVKQRIVMR